MGGDERSTLLQPRGACVCVEDLGYARAAKGQLSLELVNPSLVVVPLQTGVVVRLLQQSQVLLGLDQLVSVARFCCVSIAFPSLLFFFFCLIL